MKQPGLLNIVVFRENTEDVYAGIEWKAGSPEAEKLIQFINKELGKNIRDQSAIGIKPMSEFGSKRLVRMAIQYALKHNLPSVTMVHKGNIMKFTEGAFRDWGYEVARADFGDQCVAESDLGKAGSSARADAVVIKDRIADSMFQQLLLRPNEYSVLATPNLNGDYLSDAAAAQVGGLGIAPGGNVGDGVAVFEATHGTAPKYANLDKINPGSVILSGVMMLEYMGWDEAGKLIVQGLENAIASKHVTYDLARQMPGATRDLDLGVRRPDHQGNGQLIDSRAARGPSSPEIHDDSDHGGTSGFREAGHTTPCHRASGGSGAHRRVGGGRRGDGRCAGTRPRGA